MLGKKKNVMESVDLKWYMAVTQEGKKKKKEHKPPQNTVGNLKMATQQDQDQPGPRNNRD